MTRDRLCREHLPAQDGARQAADEERLCERRRIQLDAPARVGLGQQQPDDRQHQPHAETRDGPGCNDVAEHLTVLHLALDPRDGPERAQQAQSGGKQDRGRQRDPVPLCTEQMAHLVRHHDAQKRQRPRHRPGNLVRIDIRHEQRRVENLRVKHVERRHERRQAEHHLANERSASRE